jgi:hypothetical protein
MGAADDLDDLPTTHLDDDAYAEFLAKEFDAEGRLRDGPPVMLWIGVAIAVLVVFAVWWLT